MARAERIELRAERGAGAADPKLAGVSLTDFMLEAVSARAEEVIASADVTVVPAGFFDALWEALDEPPQPNARRARASKEARTGRVATEGSGALTAGPPSGAGVSMPRAAPSGGNSPRIYR